MKTNYLPGLLLASASIGSAQTAALPDPTLDSTGLPAYLKLLAQPAAEPWRRITEQERFGHYASLTFSPYAGLSAMFGGAISQELDSPHEWGQGWGPYGIRVASSYGGTFVANTITYGASAVFRDDNRYFRSGKDGFEARLAHVMISPYVAHNNAGRPRFSTSSFLGGVGGATIPLKWSPASWQGWNNVALNYALWYGGLAGVNLVRELYPSLVRYYQSKRRSKAPSTNTALTINIGRRSPAFPVTPPGVRVRTGRFGGLCYRPPQSWTFRCGRGRNDLGEDQESAVLAGRMPAGVVREGNSRDNRSMGFTPFVQRVSQLCVDCGAEFSTLQRPAVPEMQSPFSTKFW